MRPLFAPMMMQKGLLNHPTLAGDISEPFGSVVPSNVSLNRAAEGSSFVGLKTSQEGALFAGRLTPPQWPPNGLLKFNSTPGKVSPIGQEESERGSTRSSPLGSTCQSELQQPQSPFVNNLRRIQSEEYSKSPVPHSTHVKDIEESQHRGRNLPAWMGNNDLRPQEKTVSSPWTPNVEHSSITLSMDIESESVASRMPSIDHQRNHPSLDRVYNDERNQEVEPEAEQPRFYTFL